MKVRVKISTVAALLLLSLSVLACGIVAFGDDDQKAYSVLEKAYYQSAEDAVWIRPGNNIEIKNVSIGSDRKFSVTFRLTDNSGQPLDRAGVLTPGTVSTSFILAYIPSTSTQYTAYTTRVQTSPITSKAERQASADSGGTYTSLGDGTYTYKSGTTLPENWDQSATTTLGIYSGRNLTEWGLSTYYANELKTWVPNGAAVTNKPRDIVSTAACNNCHDGLGLHGGSRRKVELCILCHQPQSIDPDTNNTQDMPVLIHKIHRGRALPSVVGGKPYVIIGNQQSVHDYSHIAYPMDLRNCTSCHQGATQADNWFKNPTRATCGESCHDNINWETGANHVAGPASSDRFCANCHYPEGEREYDAGIKTAHVVPYESNQLWYPTLEVQSITNSGPGQSPVVKFRVMRKNGQAIPPSYLAGTTGRIRFTLAGPNTDVKWYLQESADKATSDGAGWWTYTFTGKIPADATGSYTLEGEGRVAVTLNPGTAKQTTVNNSWDTVLKPFAVTGTTVTARRSIVDKAKCDKCHDRLSFHGGSRVGGEMCFVCHNPTLTMRSGATSAGLPNESVQFAYMIHKLHTGEELEGDYLLGTTNFNEVLYPGDRRDCLACHRTGTYTVPLPAGAIAVSNPKALWTPMRPTANACLSCHDGIEAAAHAFVNTASFGESCGACHKESGDFAVSKVHAR